MEITPKQQFMAEQVEATMNIENMPLTEQARKNLTDAASGRKTPDQIAEEIKRRYRNG